MFNNTIKKAPNEKLNVFHYLLKPPRISHAPPAHYAMMPIVRQTTGTAMGNGSEAQFVLTAVCVADI